MSPTKFLYQDIPVDENLANMTGMIAANFIVFNALILTMILLVEVENELLESTKLRKKFTYIIIVHRFLIGSYPQRPVIEFSFRHLNRSQEDPSLDPSFGTRHRLIYR